MVIRPGVGASGAQTEPQTCRKDIVLNGGFDAVASSASDRVTRIIIARLDESFRSSQVTFLVIAKFLHVLGLFFVDRRQASIGPVGDAQ